MKRASKLTMPPHEVVLAWVERTRLGGELAALCCLLLLPYMGGCASHPVSLVKAEQPLLPSGQPDSDRELFTPNGQELTGLERLAQLWQRRTQDRPLTDYPMGPGDILEITVPAMEELRGRVVRISGEGTIALPLIGAVKAAGLTEEELREAIRRRLEN